MTDQTVNARLGRVEAAIDSIQQSSSRIADSLERLVRLETEHVETRRGLGRAFGKLTDLDGEMTALGGRLQAIESHMPLHQAVVGSVMALAGLIVLAALGLVWWKSTGMSPSL